MAKLQYNNLNLFKCESVFWETYLSSSYYIQDFYTLVYYLNNYFPQILGMHSA